MRHWLSCALGSVVSLAGVSCIDMGASMLEIQNAITPDTTCSISASNNSIASGYYDPALDDSGFQLILALRDNMQARTDDPELINSVNVRARQNDVEILGFEGCWYVFDGNAVTVPGTSSGMPSAYGSLHQDLGELANCNDPKVNNATPGHWVGAGSMPANGELDEGGLTQGWTSVRVLTPGHMAQLFGPDFHPQRLPSNGNTYVIDDQGQHRHAWDFSAASPVDQKARDANWGNFPTYNNVTVVARVRAVFRTQSGITPQVSNFFNMPINVCVGCLQGSCGPLVDEGCDDQSMCAGNGTCTSGTCAGGATPANCFNPNVLTGATPNYLGTGTSICLPAQRLPNPPDCTLNKVGCAASQ